MAAVFTGNKAPLIHLLKAADYAAHMQAPYHPAVALIITKLVKRDPEFGGPGRIIYRCFSFPHCVPVEVNRQVIGDDEIGFVSACIDVEFGCCPAVVIRVKGNTDEITDGIVIAVSHKAVYLIRFRIPGTKGKINIFIIEQYLDLCRVSRLCPLNRCILEKFLRPVAFILPAVIIEFTINDRRLSL